MNKQPRSASIYMYVFVFSISWRKVISGAPVSRRIEKLDGCGRWTGAWCNQTRCFVMTGACDCGRLTGEKTHEMVSKAWAQLEEKM